MSTIFESAVITLADYSIRFAPLAIIRTDCSGSSRSPSAAGIPFRVRVLTERESGERFTHKPNDSTELL